MAKKGTLSPNDPGYWDWRAKTGLRGQPKAFRSPQQLWQLACEYFKRIDENPFKKQDFIKGGESAGTIVELDQMRPYTWAGLTDYLFEQGYISTLQDYKQNREGRYGDYVEVIRMIGEVMWKQKFEGASSGAFNANIISRDLGLVDKSQMHVTEEQPLFGDEPEEKVD